MLELAGDEPTEMLMVLVMGASRVVGGSEMFELVMVVVVTAFAADDCLLIADDVVLILRSCATSCVS